MGVLATAVQHVIMGVPRVQEIVCQHAQKNAPVVAVKVALGNAQLTVVVGVRQHVVETLVKGIVL